ncbi:molecular chaperone DnaJ [Gordonia sp. PDNC005]|uniref:molecular chaperone DnaJ n=1 Tax=Gordonia sp. PDNC005 TaxID=2811424 RepID=UPI001965275E|nr:molecular chaperone DnaJ [Gordonia sp. PDNC005]QRY62721.1 molecular chaperone DnaJ [Gordonia sp. PDNC005]
MSDWPTSLTLRPIQAWPGTLTAERKRSTFSAPWRLTLNLIDRELRHLGVDGAAPAVLQIALRESDFRLDGMPRARAVADHPGVILSIESKHGPLSYPCDTFTTWQENLRAIGLALESLRRLDRYGITPGGEQYTGWKQLPTGPNRDVETRAAELLAGLADMSAADIVSDPEAARLAHRKARAASHPDRFGGRRASWDQVERAAEVLGIGGAR